MATQYNFYSRRPRLALFGGFLLTMVFFGLYCYVITRVGDSRIVWRFGTSEERTREPESISGAPLSDNGTKVILFWTVRARMKNWFIFPETETSRHLSRMPNCAQSDCILTSDHSKLKDADLLLFYMHEKPNWPKRRYCNQLYAHFMHEAPGFIGRRTFVDKFEGRINISINFRRDADFYLPYNEVVPRISNETYKARIPQRNKTKMAVWPVSHCKTASQREHYVKELAKYIDVDIYGKCGDHKCSRSRAKSCFMEWERTYKFYLSFENNVCEDYITEKLFLPLQYELIPVVLGGGNYSSVAPEHSVINVKDFRSPKALAEFLLALSADEERYQSYFSWKSHYEVVGGSHRFVCRLCDELRAGKFGDRRAKTHYADYWYGAHGEKCDNRLMQRLRKQGGW